MKLDGIREIGQKKNNNIKYSGEKFKTENKQGKRRDRNGMK